MDARAYWNSYVEKCGGLGQTADKLKTPYSTIACISNGSRGIGRNLARRFKDADPDLDETVLVWVAPISGENAAIASSEQDPAEAQPGQAGEHSDAA